MSDSVGSVVQREEFGRADAPLASRSGRFAWLPIPILLVWMSWLWSGDSAVSYSSPLLLLTLNAIFTTLISLFVAVLIGRSFLSRPTPGLLLVGCGVVVFGMAGVVSVAWGQQDVNANVIIYNACVWLAGLCHLAGAAIAIRVKRPLPSAGLYLAAAYIAAMGAVILIARSAFAHWMPVFFVQGQGGTPVRQAVLGSAITMLVGAAFVLRATNRDALAPFRNWFSLALLLIATGLLGVLAQSAFDGPLNWTARAAQYLGGVYMLIAAILSVRETRRWEVSLETALTEARQRYEDLFDLAADGIMVHEITPENSCGKIIQANRALCSLSGYGADEIRALTPLDLVPPEDRPAFLKNSALIAQTGMSRHEGILVARDGRRISCEINARLLRDHAYSAAVSVVRDITARKLAEAALARSNRELQQFSSMASHDLRAPLRTIGAFSQLLSKEYSGQLSGEADTYLRFIRDAVGRMNALIDSLLAYSQVESERPHDVTLADCNMLLGAALLNLQGEISEAQATVTSTELPFVEASERQFEQVFQNVIGNALKYRGLEAPRIHVSARREADQWVILVEDNGIGFDPSNAERIFEPFARLHTGARREGSGMGLAICKRVLERHGGRIWAESTPGKGSVFFFSLPVSRAAESAAAGTRDEATGATRSAAPGSAEFGSPGAPG